MLDDLNYDYTDEISKSTQRDNDFDPIKRSKDGNVDSVIWTTKALDTAVDAINKGLPLKANPFVGRVTQLLKPDLVYKRTKEEMDDYIHCMQDPIFFASKCFLMTPKGLQPVTLRDYQEDYIRHVATHNYSIWLAARQVGKSVTTAIFALWKIIFSTDKQCLILSKSGAAGRDLVSKVKDMFINLPFHLKPGIRKWNQSEIAFDNNSSIATEAFSPTAGLGKTINFLILDEFAWVPPNFAEMFYMNILPTVTTISDSNVCIMSTQNGFNLFYRLWSAAIAGKSMYAPFKVDWWQVPQWNPETQEWEPRTDKWHKKMVGVLGSEEAFQYQYGTVFSASDKCIVSRECLTRLHENERVFVTKEDVPASLMYPDCLRWNPDYDLENLRTDYIVLLIDLAEGGGSDYTVFNIMKIVDKDKLEQIGIWKSNEIELKMASLEFWLMYAQLFNPERTLVSIEWNTYGALFYKHLMDFNDDDYDRDTLWRFNVLQGREPIDSTSIVYYKKSSIEDDIATDGRNQNKTMRPGIKWSGSNKKTACALLKFNLEKGLIIPRDVESIIEIENFEDKNGSGSYQAAEGHDDSVMTMCQIPMLFQTPKYKEFIEDMEANRMLGR